MSRDFFLRKSEQEMKKFTFFLAEKIFLTICSALVGRRI